MNKRQRIQWLSTLMMIIISIILVIKGYGITTFEWWICMICTEVNFQLGRRYEKSDE